MGSDAAAIGDGRLADIAPTLLELMGLPQPAEMTGTSLLRQRAGGDQAPRKPSTSAIV